MQVSLQCNPLGCAIRWEVSQSCQVGENAGNLKHSLSIAQSASYQLAQLISCFLTSTSYPWEISQGDTYDKHIRNQSETPLSA